MQSTVNTAFALGVIGEFYDDGPRRVAPGVLVSADAAENIIGRVLTYTNLGNADGTAPIVVEAGGTGTFAGILVGPKLYATSGTTAGTLQPTLTLPNNTTVEFCSMGSIIVALPAAAGDTSALKYTNATGAIGIGAAGAGETAIPNAKVVRFANANASLGVIQLTN
jgi:hypothetical protein